VRIQSSHVHAARGLDAYWTPAEASRSLVALEAAWLPRSLWEPAAGDGAIVRVLEAAGYQVHASDIADYGADYPLADHLTTPPPPGAEGLVTNPPFRLAAQFATTAVSEVPYTALLLRTNFLESVERLAFFGKHPPARVWVSSRRLPMMHRNGWNGPRASSNTCHAWFIWHSAAAQKRQLGWFDWKALA
jgi:hypothetical protein